MARPLPLLLCLAALGAGCRAGPAPTGTAGPSAEPLQDEADNQENILSQVRGCFGGRCFLDGCRVWRDAVWGRCCSGERCFYGVMLLGVLSAPGVPRRACLALRWEVPCRIGVGASAEGFIAPLCSCFETPTRGLPWGARGRGGGDPWVGICRSLFVCELSSPGMRWRALLALADPTVCYYLPSEMANAEPIGNIPSKLFLCSGFQKLCLQISVKEIPGIVWG